MRPLLVTLKNRTFLVGLLVLAAFFQNCSGGFHTADSSSLSLALDGAPVEGNLPQAIAPHRTPGPIATPTPAINVVATIAAASGTYQNAYPTNVLNNDPGAYWNAGGGAPQSITFDLGQLVSLNAVSLVVAQNPASCQTRHEFYGGVDVTRLMYIGSIDGVTTAGSTISISFPKAPPQVRYVQVLTTQSCSWVSWGKVKFDASAPLKKQPNYYVGYFASGIENDYLPELSDHNNTIWITSENAMDYFPRLQSYGSMYAIVSISSLFFDGNFNLVPNYAENWANFAPKIAPYVDHIAAFYPLDEPFMNGQNHGVSQTTMKKNLETINRLIKNTFPGIPSAVIYSVQELLNTTGIGPFVIPEGYDWVSYDCYGRWDKCGDHSNVDYFNILKANMRPGQKLMVIADGVLLGAKKSDLNFYPNQVILLDRVQKDFEYFLNEPLAVGFFPFIWWSRDGSDGFIGTRDMSLILPKMKANMKVLLDRNTSVRH